MNLPRQLLPAFLAVVALVASTSPAAAAGPAVTVTDTATTLTVQGPGAGVRVQKAPWRLTLLDPSGTAVASEQDPSLPDMPQNPTFTAFDPGDGEGHDIAYPGLESVSTLPLAYLRNGVWEHVVALTSTFVDTDRVRLQVGTSDGVGATVTLTLRGRAVDLDLRLAGEPVAAVAENLTAPPGAGYFGGGQRFSRPELTGQSVPLWVSHGIGADRHGFTNEIAVPYIASTSGWAVAERTGDRGEIDVDVPARPGVVSLVMESGALALTLYVGSLQETLSAYTLDAGRNPVPPRWSFRPMFWQDSDTQVGVESAVAALRAADIPVGAYWLDNPWLTRMGDFTNGSRYPDLDGLLDRLHAQDVRVMTWVSPYVSDDSRLDRAGAVRVTGLPADNNDATYVPARGLDTHLDLTSATTYDAFVDAAADLLARGVDGFKLDRGEEDLGEAAVWADGRPNRAVHNDYVVAYDRAMRAACDRARGDDCFLLARGGAAGSSADVAHWAGDSLPVEGPAGLGAALSSMLSLSMSGQPVSGSDIGGYAGVQQTQGTNPSGGLLVRWAWLGALSPVFETPVNPLLYDAATIAAFRRAAVVHDRLADYSHGLAAQAAATGVPMVRPLPLAFPGDPVASTVNDEYLYGPDLLVAPITVGVTPLGPATRSVYVPAGTWTNVFSGLAVTGPLELPVTAALGEMPLFLRAGGALPLAIFADLDAPTTAGPAPVVPETPVVVLLPMLAVGLLVFAGRQRVAMSITTRAGSARRNTR